MDLNVIAERLRAAEETKQAIKPLRHEIGIEDLDIAYDIQNINTRFRINKGSRVVGKKIGLTSPAVQKQLGVDQPDFGILFHDMEVFNGSHLSLKDLSQPKAEAEIAFVLSKDLNSDKLTTIDVLNAIDYALPAIEIVGSRIENWDIKITDTIADNASSSHFVLGSSPRNLQDFDMVKCKMSLFQDDSIVSQGTGASCLGSPLNATTWLANTMYEKGYPLRKGEIILSGALGPMLTLDKSSHVYAEIEGLGSVSVNIID